MGKLNGESQDTICFQYWSMKWHVYEIESPDRKVERQRKIKRYIATPSLFFELSANIQPISQP